MDSSNVSEAMGLAGMNPVVGVPADHSHRGSLIVNVTNHDKDLEDDGKRMTTVARNLDMDDNLYGIDRFGKVFAKKKYDVMKRPDVWEKDIVEVFKVNKDCEPIIEQLEKEASMPYDERPIHKPTYIYEAITGHTMYTEDQMYYDRLLEKVELEKMSAVLSGTSGGLGRQKNLEQKGSKDAGYIPDNDFPSGTENMNTGIVLASAELQEGFLDAIKGKFREMHHKGIRDALTYYKYPIYAIVPYGMNPEGMFCSSFELAFNDYVFYFNKDFVKKNKLDITSKYKVPKEWWGKNKDELVEVYVLSYPKKITEPSVFTPDHLDMLDGIKFGPYHLEDLAKAMGVDSIQEAMVELWEKNGRDLKLLREISNMKIELDKDTIYSMDFEDLDNSYNGIQVSTKESTSLHNGMLSLLGIQETSSNEPRFLTQTKIPYDCEVKNCYWNMQGPIKEGQPNLILHHKNKNWRVRAELLLFKEDKVFLHKENKMTQYGTYYRIPGGGIDDPKEYIEKAACRECEEECLVIPKNVQYTGKTVFKVYEKQPYWHSQTLNKNGIYYDGSVSFICTGEYDKNYTKYVRKMDQDSMKNGAFYSYDEVKDLLSKEHKKIFEDYLGKTKQ